MSRPVLFFCLFLATLMFLSACTTTRVGIDTTAERPDYERQIYLIKPSGDNDPRDVYPRVLSGLRNRGFHLVELESDSPLFGSQGTAFAISGEGHFITSAHLFKDETEATLWLGGDRFEAKVLAKDKDIDLALLQMKPPPSEPISPLFLAAEENFRLGGEVYTIGFPLSDFLGRSPRLNKGLVSATVGMRDDPAYIQVTVETQPGNSGSPVFNSSRQVVGLMQGTLNAAELMRSTGGAAPQNVNFALKLSKIKGFLDANEITLPDAVDADEADFELLSDSVAKVRSGIVTDEMLDTDKLIAVVIYDSFWDIWHRFRVFKIVLFDFNTREIVLTAGQLGDHIMSTENSVINSTLDEVQRRLGAEDSSAAL